jgi:hypothetical protein
VSGFARVVLPTHVREQVAAVPEVAVRKAVVQALMMIEENLEFGAPLGKNDTTGDLRGCRKVYVDAPGPDKPRYRLVYWLSPSEALPRKARVLAFGARKGLRAYELAVGVYNADRASQRRQPVEQLSDAELGLSD